MISKEAKLKIAVVGATGIVGRVMMKLLTPCQVELFAIGHRSAGNEMHFGDSTYHIHSSSDFDFDKVHGVVMSAGEACAQEVRAKVSHGWLIDNSSAFRRDTDVSLVVPEIFQGDISNTIASPNCIAIPLTLVLQALGRDNIVSVWGSTYQSVSGAGLGSLNALNEKKGVYDTVSAQIGDIHDGISGEEEKIHYEVNRILGKDIPISLMAVRVPIQYGHSMHLRIELQDSRSVLEKLKSCPYIKLYESSIPDPKSVIACNKVHIGRLKVQGSIVDMWVVSDNIYRGAAWNVFQIAKQYFGVKER